jgi:hypothetical protein
MRKLLLAATAAARKAWICNTEKCAGIHEPLKVCLPKLPPGIVLSQPKPDDLPWCD